MAENTGDSMKEKPILFNGEMVRAVLDGRKTQTRRIVKGIGFVGGKGTQDDPESWGFEDKYGDFYTLAVHASSSKDYKIHCPYGKIGGRLWVRETWFPYTGHGCYVKGVKAVEGHCVIGYKAAMKDDFIATYRPSIHMPRWASRINLEITDIRVERLQEMSEQDAKAEGVAPSKAGQDENGNAIKTYRTGFVYLWNWINGKVRADGVDIGWRANPWVWVVCFKVIK